MERLQQVVPVSIKKLISAGQRACCASAESLNFFVSYERQRNKGELMLQVGYGSRDRSCLVFCFVCEMLMRHMDSDWPLPRGLEWQKLRIRPPRKSKAKAKTDASGEAAAAEEEEDTEETAAASVEEIFGPFS